MPFIIIIIIIIISINNATLLRALYGYRPGWTEKAPIFVFDWIYIFMLLLYADFFL